MPKNFKNKEVSKEFTIPLTGLKEGLYNFEYKINDEFFCSPFNGVVIENSEINKWNIKVELILEKLVQKTSELILNFKWDGRINTLCDRCGEDFMLPIKGEQRVIIKSSESKFSDSENVVTIPPNTQELNVAQYIYENISLSIPYRRVHPNDEQGNSLCNKDAIRILERFIINRDFNNFEDSK